jgi:chromosome segregation ATPase
MTPQEESLLARLTKAEDQLRDIKRQNRELRMIIEQLQKRIAQARPYMETHTKPLDGSIATKISEVINYKDPFK